MSETGEALQTYRGNCHCGGFVFEIKVPEIKSAMVCNCSICTKKGYMWLFPPKGSETIVKDDGILTEYKFGSQVMTHKFCSKCGTPVLATMGDTTAFNARAIQDLKQWDLEAQPYDGAKLGAPYEPTAYSGPEPSAAIENGKVYHGSCHCGAVKAAVKLPEALDGNSKERVVECNCSICMRAGFIWIYPESKQVALEGAENLTHYGFNRDFITKTFCKTCGVYLTNEIAPKAGDQVAISSEADEAFRARMGPLRPFNIRVLDGVNLASVKTQRLDGAGSPPVYQAP